MNKSLLFVGLIVLTAGCLHVGGVGGLLNKVIVTEQERTIQVEDIRVTSEAIPIEIAEGNLMTLFFTVENSGNTTVNDVSLTLTDPCILTTEDDLTIELEDMFPGEIEDINIDMRASTTPVERNCEIRYQTSYTSHSFGSFDFVAISEEERIRQERRQEDEHVTVFYDTTNTPVQIDFSYSKDLPIESGDDFFVYMKFTDKGANGVTKIAKDDFNFTYSTNVAKFIECDELISTGNSGELELSRDLTFSKGETKIITCKMEAENVTIIEKGRFEVETSYLYTLRDSINVRVVPE